MTFDQVNEIRLIGDGTPGAIPEKDYDGMMKGEIFHWTVARWLLSCPRCGEVMSLAHTITLSEDGKVTISPSVGHDDGKCGAHFLVKDSVIQWVSDYAIKEGKS